MYIVSILIYLLLFNIVILMNLDIFKKFYLLYIIICYIITYNIYIFKSKKKIKFFTYNDLYYEI